MSPPISLQQKTTPRQFAQRQLSALWLEGRLHKPRRLRQGPGTPHTLEKGFNLVYPMKFFKQCRLVQDNSRWECHGGAVPRIPVCVHT